MVKRVLLIICAACAVIIAGCSTEPTGPSRGFIPHVDRPGLEPLLNAKMQTQTRCSGQRLFSAGETLADFPFECSKLGVTATLNELRDAGWRVESIHVGNQQVKTSASGAPVDITISKVY